MDELLLSDGEICITKIEAEGLSWTHKPHPSYEKEKYLLKAQLASPKLQAFIEAERFDAYKKGMLAGIEQTHAEIRKSDFIWQQQIEGERAKVLKEVGELLEAKLSEKHHLWWLNKNCRHCIQYGPAMVCGFIERLSEHPQACSLYRDLEPGIEMRQIEGDWNEANH